MTLLVVDASAFLEVLLATPHAPEFVALLQNQDSDIHTPALCDVEIGSALRRLVVDRTISSQRATEALQDYLDLPMSRHGHGALLHRAMELRSNFSFYDAMYAVLAEQMEATLVTADKKLASAVRSHLSLSVVFL